MNSKNKIYHLCNPSFKVVFRDEEDYLIAISRLAACAYTSSTEIWAYAFMSTHFHLVVKSEDITSFITLLKINITRWHNKKYINNIKIDIFQRELLNAGAIKTAVNYVLKNPIHHNITNIAFRYPYSSAHIYFKEQIYPQEYYKGERSTRNCQSSKSLSDIIYRKLFASHKVPDTYMTIGGKFILPDSFIKVGIIEKLYSNAREFMYHMNKPLKEELEMFSSDESGNNSSHHCFNESKADLFGKLTDIQVCRIIDEYLYPRTYTQVTPEEKTYLTRLLKSKGVDMFQLERVF